MKKIVAIIMVSMVFFSSFGLLTEGRPTFSETEYAMRSPIYIEGDSEFTFSEGIAGGSGILGDPYIIENWEIDGSGYSNAITIFNTTKYFEIRDCKMYDTTDRHIYLRNVGNGSILNNNMTTNPAENILLYDCQNITIDNNEIFKTASGNFGIRLTINSNNNSITNNKIIYTDSTTSGNGIGLEFDSDDCIISNNDIQGRWSNSVSTLGKRGRLDNNTILQAGTGIQISSGGNDNIVDNNYITTLARGIWLTGGKNAMIYQNTFVNVTPFTDQVFGLDVLNQLGGYSYQNTFIDCQGRSNVDTFFWNGSYGIGGNYWWDYTGNDQYNGEDQDINGADGIGDTAYTLLFGSTTLDDEYPFMYSSLNRTTDQTVIAEEGNNYLKTNDLDYNEALLGVNATDSTGQIRVGQRDAITTDNIIYRGGLRFNTSYDTTTKALSSAVVRLHITGFSTVNFVNFTMEFSGVDYNETFDDGDWNLTDTPMDTINSTYMYDQTGSYIEFNVTPSFVNDSGYTDFRLKTDAEGIDPPDDTNSFVLFSRPQDVTESQRPAIIMLFKDKPVAEAGLDKYGVQEHYFNGSDSSDNDGTITNWTWNFTYNGLPVTLWGENVSFDFSIIGNYTITLNATDNDGYYSYDTLTVFAFNHQPIANISAYDSITRYRGIILFSANDSYDLDGSIVNWTWEIEHEGSPSYVYGEFAYFDLQDGGINNITLNITDDTGLTVEDYATITVINIPPIADAGTDQAGLKGIYTLDGTGSADIDGSITNWTWNFTFDGSPVELYGEDVDYNFNELGDYFITLNVTDNDGDWDIDTTWVNITNADPVADAGNDQNGKRILSLDGTGSYDVDGSIANWTWTFSDNGTPITLWGAIVSYDFNITQSPITITLNVTDDEGGTDEDTVEITIAIDSPTADAGVVQGDNKGIYTMDGSGSTDPDGSIANWTWTFNDGGLQTIYGVNAQYGFFNEGEYEITLTVRDDDWRTDTDTTWVNITFKDPVANGYVWVNDTNKGTKYLVSTSTDEDGSITNWTWEFIYNASTVYLWGENVSYDFLINTTYELTLTIEDDDENEAEIDIEFEIIYKYPIAIIDEIDLVIINGSQIFINGNNSYDIDGSIVNYTWQFDYNGTNYTLWDENFNFTFLNEEAVNITLTVTDDNGFTDTSYINLTIGNEFEYLAYFLILLLPLFIVLLFVIVIHRQTKRTLEDGADL